MMRTLNVIGAGRVGATLASLWKEKSIFAVQDVLSRTLESAHAAVALIGSGNPAINIAEMRAANLWMLTPPDDAIAECCARLAANGLLRKGDIVFHCSGALPSGELKAAAASGAYAASVHPLKSFADSCAAARSFAGTYCAAEGDRAALDVLIPAFESIGARVAEIDPKFKTIYHAAGVIVSNDLTALMEAGLRCCEKAGIARDVAAKMMEPLARETVDNVFHLGTARALTGPVARGDETVVVRQLQALAEWNPHIMRIYRELGALAVELSKTQGKADAAALARLARLFEAQQEPGVPR